MSEKQNEISVYQTRRFEKALCKLSEAYLKVVEDQIDIIIANPEIGEQKKGDLSHLRVHKFRINQQLFLLAYAWIENALELYLLQLGSHENFYQKMKAQRKVDVKLLKS